MPSVLRVLTWTVGTNVALTLALLGTAFAMWSKLADVSAQVAAIAAQLHR